MNSCRKQLSSTLTTYRSSNVPLSQMIPAIETCLFVSWQRSGVRSLADCFEQHGKTMELCKRLQTLLDQKTIRMHCFVVVNHFSHFHHSLPLPALFFCFKPGRQERMTFAYALESADVERELNRSLHGRQPTNKAVLKLLWEWERCTFSTHHFCQHWPSTYFQILRDQEYKKLLAEMQLPLSLSRIRRKPVFDRRLIGKDTFPLLSFTRLRSLRYAIMLFPISRSVPKSFQLLASKNSLRVATLSVQQVLPIPLKDEWDCWSDTFYEDAHSHPFVGNL